MIPHRKRILIVDDSPTSLVWQLVLLQEEQFDTLTATTTAEGVRIAKLERPDLLVLDATRRQSETVAAATELRADPQTCDIPILVIGLIGARGRVSGEVDSLCDACVSKPLQGVEYLLRINELLGRSRR